MNNYEIAFLLMVLAVCINMILIANGTWIRLFEKFDHKDERIPGWMCQCGNWQDDDFHCSMCGAEPPWGCDCSDHDEDTESEGWEERLFDDQLPVYYQQGPKL